MRWWGGAGLAPNHTDEAGSFDDVCVRCRHGEDSVAHGSARRARRWAHHLRGRRKTVRRVRSGHEVTRVSCVCLEREDYRLRFVNTGHASRAARPPIKEECLDRVFLRCRVVKGHQSSSAKGHRRIEIALKRVQSKFNPRESQTASLAVLPRFQPCHPNRSENQFRVALRRRRSANAPGAISTPRRRICGFIRVPAGMRAGPRSPVR
jgi:hypothetical protein